MSSSTLSLAELSSLDQKAFTAALDGVFEHSPWIAERTWVQRPFGSLQQLHQALLATLEAASDEEKLALICAHPELAGREAQSGSLTAASSGEQRGAGLDQCSREELLTLRELNARYREHFGFPFVVAVKGMSRYQIIDALQARLENPRAREFRTCLQQIGRIAGFRLEALLDPS